MNYVPLFPDASKASDLRQEVDSLKEAIASLRAGQTAPAKGYELLQKRREQPAPAPKRASKFIRVSDLEGIPVPDRQWLVPEWIPMCTVTLFYGDGGTGKSLAGLQLCSAVALGRSWLGMPTIEGNALCISAEDDLDELHRRLAAIAQSEQLGLGEMHRFTIRSLAGEDALLANLDTRSGTLASTELLGEIDQTMGEARPTVVLLDTLADFFPGDEIQRAQARQFIGLMRGLAIKHSAAVVLLAHPSLSGLNSGTGTSGSTGWNNSVRSRLYLERIATDGYEANPDARRLTVKKTNYSRVGAEVLLTWQDGVFVAEPPESGLDRRIAANKAERVFLKLLQQFTEQGRHVSAQPSNNYAPKLFAEAPDNEGCTKRAFTTAMNLLLSAEKIEIRKHGSKSRERSHIVIAPERFGEKSDEI